jgi:hypothetical protein
MKTVVNTITGQVLRCFFGEIEIFENEILIEAEATGNFYNFEENIFYEATT